MILAKQLVCQKYIFKLHSSRLRKAKWKLTLPVAEARRNDEVISLADSQVLRWLDELNGITDAESHAREIKMEIRRLRREPNSVQNRRKIKKLYADLDDVQFKPDYLCVIIDREKDYHRACKGFSINGMKYQRLLGTNGGVKNETIVFISARHADEIKRRIDNGRNMEKEMVPAKLEAYKALTCSASIPVSMPHGVLVVSDCETEFLSDIIYLNDENSGEPIMEERKQVPVQLNESDGYGLMLPSLAKRWSEELELDYTVSGVNTRFSWEKGMVFAFDFLDFAEKIAGSYFVKDAWGNDVDIRNVELILTTSMLKLWDSYDSCEDYIRNCLENGYTFGIAKTCPKELEQERTLNYQFIQSYDLSDEDIEELIRPTMDEIKEVLYADPVKTVLFLKGAGMNEDNIGRTDNDFAKALMIEPRMIDDPYVQNCIYQMIKNRINEAKVGVIKVHGNYSIVCGDPFSLCQHIFGLTVTGLLKSGEIYNAYWCSKGIDSLACFRAPMTCHNNIRLVHPHRSEDADYWYQHMKTCTLFNSWDTAAHALNGMDKDGDLVMLTDNKVLVDKLKVLPALMCVQRKAKKKIVSEEDSIQANIDSFGDDIGKTTNWITSMFDVQAQFQKGSREYEELDYRIKCGQLFQQNAIDKAKGIIAKPMPREWHDRHSVNMIEDADTRRFYQKLVADKKPYFMRIIYPALMKQYNTYIKNTNKNAMREFQMTVDELMEIPASEQTERQKDFIRYYHSRMPVGNNDCVMNRICRRFEREFDGYLGRHNADTEFDYTIMKSEVEYSRSQFNAISKLYESYNKRLRNYAVFASYERVDEYDTFSRMLEMRNEFIQECTKECPDRFALCNIVLDICYQKSSTKRFAWEMCGDEIIQNLLKRNGGIISYPTLDVDGDITFGGNRFTVMKYRLEESDEYSPQ
mgnify:FL=1